jgi:hypothetical protein
MRGSGQGNCLKLILFLRVASVNNADNAGNAVRRMPVSAANRIGQECV